MTDERILIYGDSISGNCYKLQLLCAQLDIPYDWQEVDILKGDTRTNEFLAMNANGKIPLLALPDGRYLSESNAILGYLAADSDLAGRDRYTRAEILQWLFFEQYSHEPNIDIANAIKVAFSNMFSLPVIFRLWWHSFTACVAVDEYSFLGHFCASLSFRSARTSCRVRRLLA